MPTSAEHNVASVSLGAEAPRYVPLETVSIRLHGTALASGQLVVGILSNISETGACVITNLPTPVGASVVLELETTRVRDQVEIPSGVLWCAERMEPVKEIVGFLTGLRFAPESAEAAKALLESGIFQLIP